MAIKATNLKNSVISNLYLTDACYIDGCIVNKIGIYSKVLSLRGYLACYTYTIRREGAPPHA
jgi:hypothetical protein